MVGIPARQRRPCVTRTILPLCVCLCIRAVWLSNQHVCLEDPCLCSCHRTFETINCRIIDTLCCCGKIKDFYHQVSVFLLSVWKENFSVDTSKLCASKICAPMIRNNSNNGFFLFFLAAWSMTLICSYPSSPWGMCHIFRYCLPPIHRLCSSPSICRAFPNNASFSLIYLFFTPSQFLLPSFVPLSLFMLPHPSLSVTLWIFASLLRNTTQGTRAL